MPSFTSAKDLRNRVESLPEVPRWSHQDITIDGFRTKSPITLYWRDGLEVVRYLFVNPVFAPCMEMTPYKLIDEETNLRAFGDFMSGEFAWDYQVRNCGLFFDTISHGFIGKYPSRPHHARYHWRLQ